MLNINDIDKTVAAICNKLLSGAVSPDQRNAFYNLVNLDLLKLKAGLPEDFQTRALQGHQVTFKQSDDISLFITERDINKASNGFFPRPSNYAAFDYVQFAYVENKCGKTEVKWKAIEPVTGAERAIRTDSHLIPPTMEMPIIRWNALGWGVDPKAIKQIRLTYLRMPAKPVYGFTMIGDQEVYDAATSVNAEWAEPMFGDFVIRVCKYFGINIRENELVQFSEQRQLQGQ